MTDIYDLFVRGTNKDFLSFSQLYGVVLSLFYKQGSGIKVSKSNSLSRRTII